MKRPVELSWIVSDPKRSKHVHIIVESQPYFDYHSSTINLLKRTYMIVPHHVLELIQNTWMNTSVDLRDPVTLSSWVAKYVRDELLAHHHR